MSETNNIQDKCNIIEQKAVKDLLDGSTFYIPSYQRGYRWTKTQIYDLCNDLLEYALIKPTTTIDKETNTPITQKAFYSLQPLIVKKASKMVKDRLQDVYEVIDGQQRLTSIYILYKLLMRESRYTSPEDLKKRKKVSLYHIYYETRPDDYDFVDNLAYQEIFNKDIRDIDLAHIVNSYNYIRQWLNNTPESDPQCAQRTWEMFSDKEFTLDDVIDILFKLLNNPKSTSEPNAQFIWYEIDKNKDAIQEFLSENKGKIRLTDTEKIRGLFMQRKDKTDIGNFIQLGIAKDWELIENTLHRNDFWSFISNDKDREDGRINLIFQYIYDRDCKDKSYKGKDYLFRYYYNLFNGSASGTLTIVSEWEKVMEAFRMLQNWYQNPRVYNLIGLLIKEKTINVTIKDISDLYDAPKVKTTDDFILSLKKKVCEDIISKIPIIKGENQELDMRKEDEYISLFFDKSSDKAKIPGLLRFLNVNIMCQQIEQLLQDVDKPDEEKRGSDMGRSNRDEECAIYRFPFDALDAFGWDIEHIDSASSNSLTNPIEQKTWIEEAEEAFEKLKEDQYYKTQKEALDKGDGDRKELMNNVLKAIRLFVGEDDDEVRKNWIGNLTLLDSGTNRIYKNKIFAKKRQIFRERLNRGVFAPVCTQNIFSKTYPGCTKDNLRWDFNDKKQYHKYILNVIQKFLKKYNTENQESK